LAQNKKEPCRVPHLAFYRKFTKIKKDYPELREVIKKMSTEASEIQSELIMDGVVL
jgi:hypothetical protein